MYIFESATVVMAPSDHDLNFRQAVAPVESKLDADLDLATTDTWLIPAGSQVYPQKKGGQMSAILEIRHLSKAFGTNKVLKDIDFTVRSGDVTSIIGASGSENPPCCVALTFGNTHKRRDTFSRRGHNGKECQRLCLRAKVGMVFQSFNLSIT